MKIQMRARFKFSHAKVIAVVRIVAAVVSLNGGCTEFEDSSKVIDLRMLAIASEPAEVVIDIDLTAEDPIDGIDQSDFVDVTYCALVADPSAARRLSYSYSVCRRNRSFRCDQPNDPGDTVFEFGTGSVNDPEDGPAEVSICATLSPDAGLQALLLEAFEDNPASIINGIDLQIQLRIDSLGPTRETIYGRRSGRYAGRFPIDRVANNNPRLDGINVIRADGSVTQLPRGRCGDIEPLVVFPGEKIEVTPIEPEGLREDYVLVDLEQNRVPITENISYDWFSTAGDWRKNSTGGDKDFADNVPLVRNFWTAPEAPESGDGDIHVWVTQRDERLGSAWFQSCVRVSP